MNLASVFGNVAHKKLVAVDLPESGSNQHELNGVDALKGFFGTEKKTRGFLQWHYFADDQESLEQSGEFTFYDARAKSSSRTGRSEWRFYYYGNFLAYANVGDWFFLARGKTGAIFALIFQRDSAWLRAAQTLFGIQETTATFDAIGQKNLDSQSLELLQRQILAELGLDLAIPVAKTDEELMLSKFGETFPTTKIMSEFARGQSAVDVNQTDETLVAWLDREESLFRALENVIIRQRLIKGFADVDDFIGYSLSVQNRRKSRMGFSLQNHLTEIFTHKQLRFTPQARTESNNKPDFIFPGVREYHSGDFDAGLLVMLGVKSSSKDRWRQVLTEADRIPKKHLCTLEPGISTKQTEEMARHQLTLVVPSTLHATYSREQRRRLLTISDFVEFVRSRQV